MSTLDRARPVTVLWRNTVPAALAAEAGAVVVATAGVVPGLVTAAVAVLALGALGRVWLPPGPLLRALLLLSGPPLRYLLLALAAWRVWIAPGGGPLPALAAVGLLGLVLPLASTAAAGFLSRRFPGLAATTGGEPEEVDR